MFRRNVDALVPVLCQRASGVSPRESLPFECADNSLRLNRDEYAAPTQEFQFRVFADQAEIIYKSRRNMTRRLIRSK